MSFTKEVRHEQVDLDQPCPGMAVSAAGKYRLRCTASRRACQSGPHAGQFAGLDHPRRHRGGGRGMTPSVEKPAEITEENIRRLVDAFYVRVRADSVLGPIFERAIPGDWQPHLEKMYAFWSSVMLTSGRYKGNPVVK